MKFQENYFLSGWIENLGVVPLFSFAFFLSLPIFFLLSLLLHLVCIVFEAISYSLSYVLNNIRVIYITFLSILVKVFLLGNALAAKQNTSNTDIYLSTGEQYELSIRNLDHFSVGNKDILKYKYRKKNQTLLIKAKKIGYSDIAVWHKDKTKLTYNIYISSKREFLKKMQIHHALKKMNITTTTIGNIIYLDGEIKSQKDLSLLKNIIAQKGKNIVSNLRFSKKFIRKILSTLYYDFYKEGGQYINCHARELKISCQFEGDLTSQTQNYYQDKFDIEFFNEFDIKSNHNYRLKFHFFISETNNLNLRNMGINKIKTSLHQFVSHGQSQLETEDIIFQDSDTIAKLIATPELKTSISEQFNLKIGSEIPFQTQKDGTVSTDWKFIGLLVDGKLNIQRNQLKLAYKTKFQTPNNKEPSGPASKSSLFISEND